jgi:hypothetical protein
MESVSNGSVLRLHPCLVTPLSRVLLEKLTVTELVKKFPSFLEPEGSLPCSQEAAKSDALCNIS